MPAFIASVNALSFFISFPHIFPQRDIPSEEIRERMKDMGSSRTFAAAAVAVFGGYLAGVLSVLLRGEADTALVTDYLTSQTGTNWLQAFASGPFFVLLVLFCGVFFFGWLFALPLIFYKSYGLGYTAGLFLAALGTRGFLPLGLCLFPSAAAECVILIRGCRDALPMSFSLFRGLSQDATPFFSALKSYLLRSLVLFQCSAFVLLWDLFLAPLILSGIRDLL